MENDIINNANNNNKSNNKKNSDDEENGENDDELIVSDINDLNINEKINTDLYENKQQQQEQQTNNKNNHHSNSSNNDNKSSLNETNFESIKYIEEIDFIDNNNFNFLKNNNNNSTTQNYCKKLLLLREEIDNFNNTCEQDMNSYYGFDEKNKKSNVDDVIKNNNNNDNNNNYHENSEYLKLDNKYKSSNIYSCFPTNNNNNNNKSIANNCLLNIDNNTDIYQKFNQSAQFISSDQETEDMEQFNEYSSNFKDINLDDNTKKYFNTHLKSDISTLSSINESYSHINNGNIGNTGVYTLDRIKEKKLTAHHLGNISIDSATPSSSNYMISQSGEPIQIKIETKNNESIMKPAIKIRDADHLDEEDEKQIYYSTANDGDFIRRYSAADASKFKYYPPNVSNRNYNDDFVSKSLLIPSTTNQKSTKKISNLKKTPKVTSAQCNNNSINSTKPKQSEKVKFSNIELRHLIDKNIEPDTQSNHSSHYATTRRRYDFDFDQDDNIVDMSSILPILKKSTSNSNNNENLLKCTTPPLLSSTLAHTPPKMIKTRMPGSGSTTRRRKLKHSNTINEIDLHKIHRSNSGNYGQHPYYINLDDYGLFKSSQPSILDNYKLFKLKHPISDFDIKYSNKIYSSSTSITSSTLTSSSSMSNDTDMESNILRTLLHQNLLSQLQQEKKHHRHHRHHKHHHKHKHKKNKKSMKSNTSNTTSANNNNINTQRILTEKSNSLIAYPQTTSSNQPIYSKHLQDGLLAPVHHLNRLSNEKLNATQDNYSTNRSIAKIISNNANATNKIITIPQQQQQPQPLYTNTIYSNVQVTSTPQPSTTSNYLNLDSIKTNSLKPSSSYLPGLPHHLHHHNHHHTLKPASSAQINRILTSNKHIQNNYLHLKDTEDSDNLISAMSKNANKTNNAAANYSDLIAENTAFINSPIRSLTNHHKNQRLLKQKKQNEFQDKLFPKNKSNQTTSNNDNNKTNNKLLSPSSSNNDNIPLLSYQSSSLTEASPSITINNNLKVIDNPTPSNSNEKKDNNYVINVENNKDIKQLTNEDDSMFGFKTEIVENKNADDINMKTSDINNNENDHTKRNKYLKFRIKKIIALILISVITISSIHLLETISCFIKKSLNNLLMLKFSVSLTSFVFVVIMSLRRCCNNPKKVDNIDEEAMNIKYEPSKELKLRIHSYYNIFSSYDYTKNEDEEDEENNNIMNDSDNELNPNRKFNKNELNLQKDNENNINKQKKREEEIKNAFKYIYQSKIKSNFYLIMISILLINFWVISTYLFGFIFSASSHNVGLNQKIKKSSLFLMSNSIEMATAFIGGMGIALFIKQIILALFEISSSNRNQLFKKIIKINKINFSQGEDSNLKSKSNF